MDITFDSEKLLEIATNAIINRVVSNLAPDEDT